MSAQQSHKKELRQEAAGPWYLKAGWPLLWIASLAFLIYGQVLSFDYTYLDDNALIKENIEWIDEVSDIPGAFENDVFFQTLSTKLGYYYRPMLTLSFITDALMGGDTAKNAPKDGPELTVFHFTNILLHLLCVWLFFIFLSELGYDRIRSFFGALLFLLHPIITQVIAWIPGRNDSLMVLFLLPAMIFFIRYWKKPTWVNIGLHFLFFSLALFTKETTIALPVVAGFYFLFILKKPLKALLLRFIIPWGGIILIFFQIRRNVLGSTLGFSLGDIFSALSANFVAIFAYIGKVFVPVNLSVFPILEDMRIHLVAGVIASIVLIALAWRSGRSRANYILFAALWFTIFLCLSFIQSKESTPNFSEHRIYLALMGMILFLLELKGIRNLDFRSRKVQYISAGLLLLLTIGTFIHSKNFKDRFAFWENAVETSPSYAFNYNNLGGMYLMENNLKKAENYYRGALKSILKNRWSTPIWA